ncbi:hypothetical protein GALMADRAFT_214796 [Galerina marginata CBS 339.88]|uniref:VWFA domain-containing protein n=1 Tax=Galerina marginata (strain CBS 339.88) TaxID=685588 RepID=A0A067SJ60_GALM3|nr:hypothetical protein GALMADRAFT_214796 [Galerina marginata CBS 339.88]
MAGSQTTCAKEALVIFLQNLSTHGTLFNIFSFGSDYSSLWPSSQPYTPSTLDIACRHGQHRNNIWAGQRSGISNSLSLFLLTDDEVLGHEVIFALVDREVTRGGNTAGGTQLGIFTVGIGNAASTAPCEGVVAHLLLASTVPPLGSMGDVEIDWGHIFPTLKTGDKGKITASSKEDYDPIGDRSLRFLPDRRRDEGFPPLIHTLAAHRLILELENGDISSKGSFDTTDEKLRDAVIEAVVVHFSETYQLASQFASSTAVDEGRDNQQDGGTDGYSSKDSDDDLQHYLPQARAGWAKRHLSLEQQELLSAYKISTAPLISTTHSSARRYHPLKSNPAHGVYDSEYGKCRKGLGDGPRCGIHEGTPGRRYRCMDQSLAEGRGPRQVYAWN